MCSISITVVTVLAYKMIMMLRRIIADVDTNDNREETRQLWSWN